MSFFKKAQQQIAHTSTVPVLGNQDLRTLQDVISSEKDFIKTNSRAAADYKKNAEAIKAWAADEGADLNDVLGKLSLLMDNYSSAQNRLNTHLSTVRLHFKSIRTREESFAELKSRKRSLGSNIERVEKKLAKMGPENKELMKVTAQLRDMRSEMDGLRVEVMEEEAAIGDFKRRTAKEALGIKCGGLLEMAEKLTIVAEVGKLLLDEIPTASTQPGMPRTEYFGFARTEQLLQEANRNVADVAFTPIGPSSGIPRFGNGAEAGTPGLDSPLAHRDEGYNPYGGMQDDASRINGSIVPGADSEDLTGTPIYATHASRWNPETHGSTFNSDGLHDPATDEWGQRTGGEGAYPVEDEHGRYHEQSGAADEGFLVQHSSSAQGTTPSRVETPAQSSSHHTEEQGQQLPADQDSLYASPRPASAGPSRRGTNDVEGYGDPNRSAVSSAAPVGPASDAGSHSLGAPTLPPLRTTTPLPSATLDGAAAPGHATTAKYGGLATGSTYGATADDPTYFQSVGGTRAHQEAVRGPLSPAINAPLSPGSRQSTYGSLAPGQIGAGSSDGGKKVTAAAFRRGFGRVPSAQTLTTPSGEQSGGATTPVPPGGYTGFDSPRAAAGGASPESEVPPSLIQPLHISKRNSAIGAAAAAGSPANLSGRRYSIEDVGGSDAPAPPYGYGAPANGNEQPGTTSSSGLYTNGSDYAGYQGYSAAGHGGNSAPLPAPPVTYGYPSSQGSNAPPPPLYGHN